jgi:hypothetical protein
MGGEPGPLPVQTNRPQLGRNIELLKNPEDPWPWAADSLQASTGFQPPAHAQVRTRSPQTGLRNAPSPQADPRRQGKNGENAFKFAAAVAIDSLPDVTRCRPPLTPPFFP